MVKGKFCWGILSEVLWGLGECLKKGSKFVHARPVFWFEDFWVDHVVDVFAALFVGLNDDCFGIDEGKVVSRVVINLGWCIYSDFLCLFGGP